MFNHFFYNEMIMKAGGEGGNGRRYKYNNVYNVGGWIYE